MARNGIFGWDYPAGCTGPDVGHYSDPSELVEAVLGALEEELVPQVFCDAVVNIIERWEDAMSDETRDAVLGEIKKERIRQIGLAHGGDTDEFDKGNSKNDWVAYIAAYAGRAADKVGRNERGGESFRSNILKVAALCVAALEAEAKGYFKP